MLEKKKIEDEQIWVNMMVYGRGRPKSLAALAETSFFVIHFNKHTVVSKWRYFIINQNIGHLIRTLSVILQLK